MSCWQCWNQWIPFEDLDPRSGRMLVCAPLMLFVRRTPIVLAVGIDRSIDRTNPTTLFSFPWLLCDTMSEFRPKSPGVLVSTIGRFAQRDPWRYSGASVRRASGGTPCSEHHIRPEPCSMPTRNEMHVLIHSTVFAKKGTGECKSNQHNHKHNHKHNHNPSPNHPHKSSPHEAPTDGSYCGPVIIAATISRPRSVA